jgi:hypothetical protein
MAQEEVNILRIEVDQASAAKELAAVRKSIAELTKERNELNKKIKEGNELTEEEIKDLGRVEKQLAEAKNGEREFTKVIQAQNNSLNQLRNSLAQLTRLRNQVDTSTDDGRKRFADLTVQIKEYSDSIKRAEEAGGDFRRSVGNYGKALEGLRGAAGKARQSISFLGKALAATGIIKLVGILSSVASSFTSTNEGAEELAKLLGQIEGISKPFIQQMQKIGLVVGSTLVKAFTQVGAVLQSFKNFDVFNFSESIKSIEDAIAPLSKTISEAGEEIEKINAGFDFNKAIEEGKRLGAQFAALRKNQRDLNIEQAKYERDLFKIRNNIEALKNIRDNETQSIIKRIDANEQLSQLEKDALTEGERIAKRRIELIQQEINLNGGRAKSSEELVLSEIEAQKVLFEIQEDSAGRVNENITNRVALQREASEQELEVFTRLSESEIALLDELNKERLEKQKQLAVDLANEEINALQNTSLTEQQKADTITAINNELYIKLNQLDADYTAKYKAYQDEQTADVKEGAANRAAIRQQETQQALQASADLFGTLAAQFDQASAEYKIFATGQATASFVSQLQNIVATNTAPSQPGNLATFGGAGAIASAIQIAAATAQFGANLALINRAAGGGDFVTTKPTMLLVGDNPGGRERVTVEPLSGRGQTKIHPGSGMVAMAGGGTLTAGSGTGIMSASREASSQFAQATALQQALRNMPAPVVSVKDINTVQGRVTVKDNISRI